jgi:hypothetical protein
MMLVCGSPPGQLDRCGERRMLLPAEADLPVAKPDGATKRAFAPLLTFWGGCGVSGRTGSG